MRFKTYLTMVNQLAQLGHALSAPEEEYVHGNVPQLIHCLACAAERKVIPNNMIGSYGRAKKCPECGDARSRKSIGRFKREIRDRSFICVSDTYTNAHTKLRFCCKECSRVWLAKPSDILSHYSGCPACAFHGRTDYSLRFKKKQIRVRGKEFSVQGYEPQAIRFLVASGLAKASKIYVGKDVPVVWYKISGVWRKHYPDLWVPNSNMIVEVKSTYTLLRSALAYRTMKLKRKYALSEGYGYSLFVMQGDGGRLVVPDWWSLTYQQAIRKFLKAQVKYV